jgi:ribonucleotide monophosphatase NagD (HAD superfamily)
MYDDGVLSDLDDVIADDNENIGETNTTITNTYKIGVYILLVTYKVKEKALQIALQHCSLYLVGLLMNQVLT